MELNQSPIRSNRPKKACTECRQQKARCDAYIEPGKACSRCRRINLRCVISEPFQRMRKRQRNSDFQLEASDIQRNLRAPTYPQTPSSPIATLTPVRGDTAAEEANHPSGYLDLGERPNNIPTPFRPVPTSTSSLDASNNLDGLSKEMISSYKIEGVDIDSTDIDGLFHTYFRDYALFMPLLDPNMAPKRYYSRCPLLFWAIAAVASRTYSGNPTLLELLSSRVRNLALLSLGQDAALYSVQGLLLLLKWPPPRTHVNGDLNWPLCGAVIHMAMQIGLHLPLSSQEYSKVRLRLSEADVNHRIQTWAYCILVYQEICVGKGTPPTLLCDISHDSEQRHILLQGIGPSLRFEIKLQEIIAKFGRAVSNHGLRSLSEDQERSLGVLVHAFQSQLDDIKPESSSGIYLCLHLLLARLTSNLALNQLSHSIACLVIATFELYKTPSGVDPQSLVALYSPACEFLERMNKLDIKGEIAIAAAPVYYLYGLLLSCQILIRLSKTSFSRYIDVERVKAAFFTGINLSKRMAVVNNDIFSRHAAAATQLWNSNKAFKKADGTELLVLRIRSRLAMSPVLDGLAWWREEYGGYQGVYPPWMNEPAILPARDAGHSRTGPSSPTVPAENQDTLHLSDPFFAELGWAMDEALLSPWMATAEPPAIE